MGLGNELGRNEPDGQYRTDNEDERAEGAEEMHRLLAEFLQEPDGQQV